VASVDFTTRLLRITPETSSPGSDTDQHRAHGWGGADTAEPPAAPALRIRAVPSPAAVVVEDLVIRYGSKVAVDGLSLSLPCGAVSAVLGPNGAGKTSTVECAEGYRRPSAGTVRVLGLDPATDGAALRAKVGVMLQEGGVAPSATAVRALRSMASFYRHPLPVEDLVERLGLGGLHRTPFRRMSGGEKQRVKLAVAVIGRPALVFLDEPTSGLDPQARHAVWDLVRQLRSDGVTVVLTSHMMEEVEALADLVAIMDAGRLLVTGTPHELTSGAAQSLHFQAPPALDTAALAAALPAGTRVWEGPAGSYRVEGVVGPDLLAAVTAWCAGRGVLASSMTSRSRSLEDVFLELTGRGLRT
jgi:ABC-2 type transport system ATP-binding protein